LWGKKKVGEQGAKTFLQHTSKQAGCALRKHTASYEALKPDYLQNFEFFQPRQGLWMDKRKVIASQSPGKKLK